MQSQILLPGFGIRADAEFASFYAGASNVHIKQAVESMTEQYACLYLSGIESSGKSHLLQAACNQATSQGLTGVYLPLSELLGYSASSVLEGIEAADFIAIDDVHLLLGHVEWQEALFNLYNFRLDNKLSLLFSANQPAANLAIELADLQSRLTACVAYQLRSFSDEEKHGMLMFLAERYGMLLNEQCASYILLHYGRSNARLVEIMDVLAEATLVEKRKLTIPFIRQQLQLRLLLKP